MKPEYSTDRVKRSNSSSVNIKLFLVLSMLHNAFLREKCTFCCQLCVFFDSLYLSPKKTPTCFWPLVKMSHNNFLLYFVCIKAEVVFGHKIYEKLNFSQYLLSLATLHTQPMYQESFNTKILQIIDCFE